MIVQMGVARVAGGRFGRGVPGEARRRVPYDREMRQGLNGRRAGVAAMVVVLCWMPLPAWGTTALPGIAGSPGGSPAAAAGPALDSPRAALEAFLRAGADHREDGHQASLLRAIRAVELGDFSRTLLGESRSRLVRELSLVLERLGARDELDEIPDRAAAEAEGLDSFAVTLSRGDQSETIGMVRVEDGSWRISDETLKQSEAMYARVVGGEDVTTRSFRSVGLGALADRTALGLRYSTWIGLFVILLAGAVVDLVVRLTAIGTAQRYLRTHGSDPDKPAHAELVRRTARPFGLAAGGGLVYALLPLLGLPLKAEGFLLTAAKSFFLFALVWSAYRVVDLIAERVTKKHAGGDDGGISLLLIPLVTKAVKLFILALGLVFIAESLNLPITSLVAGIGIGGIALAVAAKGTLENVFGTVSVVMDRPFRVGDYIIVNGIEGTVEEFSFRSTRVRTRRDSLVTIPNSQLVTAAVENLGMRQYRQYRTMLSILYSTPPERIESFCEGIRELIRARPTARQDFYQVELNEFGASSLDVMLNMYFAVPDFPSELRERNLLMLDIIRLAERLDVDFAFPTRTLHLAGGSAPGVATQEGRGPVG